MTSGPAHPRTPLIVLTAWALLQLPRAIAVPTVFADMGGGGAMVPALQTALDLGVFALLCQRGVRAHVLERA